MLGKNIFIPMPDSKPVKIQVQLSEDLRTRFKAKCVLAGTTMNEVVVKLMEGWVDEDTKASAKSKR